MHRMIKLTVCIYVCAFGVPHGETPWGRLPNISYPQITPIIFKQSRLAPNSQGQPDYLRVCDSVLPVDDPLACSNRDVYGGTAARLSMRR